MTQDEIRKILLDSGVPENVVDYVMQFEPKAWLYLLHLRFMLLIFFLGFAGSIPLWILFNGINNDFALSAAIEQSALLYGSWFGFSFLPLFFVSFFGVGIILFFVLLLSPIKVRALYFVAEFMNKDSRGQAKMITRRLLSNNIKPSLPQQFIDSALQKSLNSNVRFAIFASLISVMFLAQEFQSHTIITKNGLQRTPILPWANNQPQNWEEIETVSLGCNHTVDSDNLKYDLKFKSGDIYYLGSMKPVAGDWLSTLEKVDQILVENNANFKRWQWLKRNPLHPKCLKAQEARYTPQEMQRLRRLLRIGTLEGD